MNDWTQALFACLRFSSRKGRCVKLCGIFMASGIVIGIIGQYFLNAFHAAIIQGLFRGSGVEALAFYSPRC